MIKKHHTPKYVYSRLNQIIFQKKYPEAPWLTQQAVGLLDSLIMPDDQGLEFGSGRSTKWFANRCGFLTSVEHNKEWYNYVINQLKDHFNVSYQLKEANDANPMASSYCQVIEEKGNGELDFILIDGIYRGLIAKLAPEKIKIGGLLVLDNAERYLNNNFNIPESIGLSKNINDEDWKIFKNKVCDWRKIWTTNGITSTLICFKKST